MKWCNGCQQEKDISSFHKHAVKGTQSKCKVCRRRGKHSYCVGCGDTLGTHRKKFCSTVCKGKHHRRTYGSSLKPFLEQLLRLGKSRRFTREALTIDYLLELWDKQEGLCALTGVPMTHVCGQGKVKTNVSIDRIDSSLGYTNSNVQLTCVVVNKMKLDMSDTELKFWCEGILNHDG